LKKQKIKKTKKPEKKIKTEDKAKLEKQPEKKTTVEKKPNTKTKEIKQRNSKKSDTFLIIGIIIMIILIVGAVIVTTILTRNKKSTVPESDANITDNVATGLTESEFRERYSKLMYDLTELSQKIQTELLSEIQVKQKPVFDKITAKLNLDKSKIDSCVAKNLNITSETKAEDAKILQKIVRDTQFAQMIGITGTPAIIINNDYAGGYLTYAELKKK